MKTPSRQGRKAVQDPAEQSEVEGLRKERREPVHPAPRSQRQAQSLAYRSFVPLLAIVVATQGIGCGQFILPVQTRKQGLDQVQAGDKLIIGKVELVPPLQKGEQSVLSVSENIIYLYYSDQYYSVTSEKNITGKDAN